jgi:uncharacterized membrane protein
MNIALKPAIAGVLAAAVLAIAWTEYVHHLVLSATLGGGPDHWAEAARVRAYGVCYDGCNDCVDVDSIEAACRLTMKPNITGVVCDASEMWFWADRYPPECLDVVGALIHEMDLQNKRFKLKFLYLLGFLALGAGSAVYVLTKRLLAKIEARQLHLRPRIRSNNPTQRTPLLQPAIVITVAITIALMNAPGVAAYACAGFHPVHNQPFISTTDPTLIGNIHGWLSDCYDEQISCGERCSIQQSTTRCDTEWCSRTGASTSPADFAQAAARRVQACGFRMVDMVPGVADLRVPNPVIEKALWVKVSVNRYNATNGGSKKGSEGNDRSSGLDEQVRCLYEMVEWPVPEEVRLWWFQRILTSIGNMFKSLFSVLGCFWGSCQEHGS